MSKGLIDVVRSAQHRLRAIGDINAAERLEMVAAHLGYDRGQPPPGWDGVERRRAGADRRR